MESKANIRYANEGDSFDIASINALSWKSAYRSIIPDKILNNISVNKWTESWKLHLQNKKNVLVIFQDKKILGFAQFCEKAPMEHLCFPCGEINSIYLHPDIWRRGYGRQLCLAVIEELKKFNLKKVVLWVLSKNINACKFYQAMGFKKSNLLRKCSLFPDIFLQEEQFFKIIKFN